MASPGINTGLRLAEDHIAAVLAAFRAATRSLSF